MYRARCADPLYVRLTDKGRPLQNVVKDGRIAPSRREHQEEEMTGVSGLAAASLAIALGVAAFALPAIAHETPKLVGRISEA